MTRRWHLMCHKIRDSISLIVQSTLETRVTRVQQHPHKLPYLLSVDLLVYFIESSVHYFYLFPWIPLPFTTTRTFKSSSHGNLKKLLLCKLLWGFYSFSGTLLDTLPIQSAVLMFTFLEQHLVWIGQVNLSSGTSPLNSIRHRVYIFESKNTSKRSSIWRQIPIGLTLLYKKS